MADPTNISRSQKLLEEMNAKYGVTSSPPAPQQAQQLAPPPVQLPQQRGLVNDAMSLIKGRQQQIDKASGYACGGKIGKRSFSYGGTTDGAVLEDDGSMAAGLGLIEQGRQQQAMAQQDLAQKFAEIDGYACGGKIKGHAQGGLIKGPGTPTSDSINAMVEDTGEQIKVSTEERILSKEQDALLGRIAQMLGFESVDQLLESGTGKPVGPTMKGGKRGLAEGGSIYGPAYDALKKIPDQAFPNTMSAIRSGGDAAKSAADSGNYGAAIGQVGRGAIGGIVGLGNDVMNSAAYALDPAANALKTFVTGDSSPARNVAPSKPMAAQGITSSPLVDGANYGNEGRSVPSRITKDYPSAIVANQFTQGGTKYTANPTSQDGIQKVTGGSSPLYTNINPEQAVAGLKNQTIGQPANEAQIGLDRIANANKIRGEMIANRDKDIPAGGYGPGILGDGSLGTLPGGQSIEEWNRNVGVKTQLGLSPKDRVAYEDAAAKNEVQRRGQDFNRETSLNNSGLAAQVANNRDQVTMRGQDINERGDRLRYGNPLDIQAKQLSLTQAQRLSDIQGKYLNGTPEEKARAAEQIRALSGKDNQQSLKDNFMTAGGGQEFDEKAGIMRNVPQRLIDLRTGQDVGGQQQGPKRIGNSPYDEGTSIVGKDGKKYVVRNGQPVLAQ